MDTTVTHPATMRPQRRTLSYDNEECCIDEDRHRQGIYAQNLSQCRDLVLQASDRIFLHGSLMVSGIDSISL